MKIAFIGLGHMGGGMAANLVKAGHAVRAFDLAPAALERARGHGCATFPTVAEAVQGVEAVVTMLPNGRIVEDVYAGEVFGAAPATALLVDSSTIAVDEAQRIGLMAGARGYDMVDAPVSGGTWGAEAGTLTFMVGGGDAAFRRAEPVLAGMAQAVIHAGASGMGQAAKLCNNLILGAAMIATCEAFRLAERLGLDLRTFYDISSQGSGQNWSMTSYCPVPGVGPDSPADHDYQGGFAGALMLKDLRLAMEAAEQAGAKVPMGALAEKLYAEWVDGGHGAMDFSGIIETL